MSVNQLIAGGIRLHQFESPMNMMAQLSQLESAREANELRRMQMAQMQRQQEQEMGLMNALQSGRNLTLPQAVGGGRLGMQAFEAQQAQIKAKEQRERERRIQRGVALAGTAGRALKGAGESIDDSNRLLMGAYQQLDALGFGSPELEKKFEFLYSFKTPQERREALETLLSSISGLEETLTAQEQNRAAVGKTQAETRKLELEARQVGVQQPPAGVKEAMWYLSATPEQRQAFDSAKAAGRSVTNIVNPQESEFQRGIGRGQSDIVNKGFEASQDAQKIITTVNQGKQLLDQGMITGFGADFLTGLSRALRQVGINFKADEAANSQAYISALGANVGRVITLFGAGTGLSDADREYARQIAGGEITMDEAALRKILRINDSNARDVIARHNENVKQLGAPKNMLLTMPPQTYSWLPPADKEALDWAKSNKDDPRSKRILSGLKQRGIYDERF